MSNLDTGKPCPSSEQKANTGSSRTGCKITECPSFGSPGCHCRIRELNDQLRIRMCGGLIHMTDGIAALGLPSVNAIFQAVSQFSAFTEDNVGANTTAPHWRSKASASSGRSIITTGRAPIIHLMRQTRRSRCVCSPS